MDDSFIKKKVIRIDDITKRMTVDIVESVKGFRRFRREVEPLPVTHHIDDDQRTGGPLSMMAGRITG